MAFFHQYEYKYEAFYSSSIYLLIEEVFQISNQIEKTFFENVAEKLMQNMTNANG